MDGWREEGKNESVKRRRERSQKWAKRGRKIKHRPQNLLKKGAKIDQNRAKIDPKGFQNEDKTDKNQSNVVKMILDPPGWRFPGYGLVVMELSWVPKSSQIRKKSDAKNRWFFDRSWKRKKWEKGVQNHSKMEPKMVQNRAQKERQEENGKSVKTNNALWF